MIIIMTNDDSDAADDDDDNDDNYDKPFAVSVYSLTKTRYQNINK